MGRKEDSTSQIPRLILCLAALAAAGLQPLAAQQEVKELRLRTDPPGARVRPLESIAIQVQSFGELTQKDKSGQQVKRTGRLRAADWQMRVLTANGGWLSKPYRYQGEDKGPFADEQEQGFLAQLIRGAGSQYLIKDTVLYTAPATPGKYLIEAEQKGVKGSISVEVTTSAASLQPAETVTFPAEAPSSDPYRALAERYAPFIAQETWWYPKADIPARFDFDGDWQGDNNWKNAPTGSSQAYVYYAAMETATHWFLIYNFFHPRDYSDNCVVGTCHENDNEGVIVTVRKDGSPFGTIQTMETLAHNNVYSYAANAAIRNGVHDLDGKLELYQGTHPMVFLEAGGHGAYGVSDSHSLFDAGRMEFQKTGITLVYRGAAQRPRHANDRDVGYELLPIYDHWWLKARQGRDWPERTFDAFIRYEPFGGRPGMRFTEIGGTFYGRAESENKAKPFWGWHDNRTLKAKVLNVGQWGLDPAYAVSRNLRFPPNEPFSLDYVFNPYLEIGAPPAAQVVLTPAAAPSVGPPTAVPPAAPTSGSCEVSVVVDGSLEIAFAGLHPRYEVLSGRSEREIDSKCTSPPPAVHTAKFTVEKKEGRGSVKLTAATAEPRIRIEDPERGDGIYTVILRWAPR